MKKVKLMLAMIMATILFGGFGLADVYAVSGSIAAGATNNPITISRTITGLTNNVSNTFTYDITPAGTYTGVSGMPNSATVVFNNASHTSGTAT